MINLVRVDDRLLHGQIICAWVPYCSADMLIVASDAAASDELLKEILMSCTQGGLGVKVLNVEDAVEVLLAGSYSDEQVILVVGNLHDAFRLFEQGIHFKALNLGNLHHENGGRMLTPSVTVDNKDEALLSKLAGKGVAIEIRDVPTSASLPYSPG